MIIRKMTAEDVSQVVLVEKACFSLPWSEKSFQDSLQREDTCFLVAECDEAIAGYIGMYFSFEEASITNVAVSPDYRKRGIGRALVEAAQNYAKAAGALEIFLEVRKSNVPAISLYKETGYKELGIRKNFYEHPVEDAIIMKCEIK